MSHVNKEIQAQALSNAVTGQSLANYTAIYQGFEAKGINPADIILRENVFTYNAWRALGRQVRKGEHGVKVCTWITCKDKTDPDNPSAYKRPKTTTVFHISQTEPEAHAGSIAA